MPRIISASNTGANFDFGAARINDLYRGAATSFSGGRVARRIPKPRSLNFNARWWMHEAPGDNTWMMACGGLWF